METLRLNLSLALELCELIPESALSDDSPFFRMRYAYVAAALDENLSPLLLSFIPGAQPQRTPVLDVYLLNPYGEHRETALDYLTYVAQSQSGWLYTSLYQADETVEQADYVALFVEIKLVTKYGRILFWCIILFIARNANEKL